MTSLLAQMPSTYLKKEDFPQPARVQIAQFKKEIIGEGADAVEKIVCYFHGYEKAMVVNPTNANILVQIFGDDMDEMIGKSVAVHCDPNISFGGKLVGGLRFMIETAPPPPMAGTAIRSAPSQDVGSAMGSAPVAFDDAIPPIGQTFK